MNQPDEDVIKAFSDRLNVAFKESGLDLTGVQANEIVLATVVQSMKDGLLSYCPAWDIEGKDITFMWMVSLGEDWRALKNSTVH